MTGGKKGYYCTNLDKYNELIDSFFLLIKLKDKGVSFEGKNIWKDKHFEGNYQKRRNYCTSVLGIQ